MVSSSLPMVRACARAFPLFHGVLQSCGHELPKSPAIAAAYLLSPTPCNFHRFRLKSKTNRRVRHLNIAPATRKALFLRAGNRYFQPTFTRPAGTPIVPLQKPPSRFLKQAVASIFNAKWRSHSLEGFTMCRADIGRLTLTQNHPQEKGMSRKQ